MCSHHSLCVPTQRRAVGPAAASPGASSGCHVEAAFTPQLGASDPASLDMALLSNILAAYSFVSGSFLVLAGPGQGLGLGLSPARPSLALCSREKYYAATAQGLCCAGF